MLNICCVILNYNDYETTIELLFKIREYNTLTNIVIVDNESTDNSYEILCQYATDKIHVIATDKNGGYGYGNNYGIRYSYEQLKASYILISNPDVIFTEDCVTALENALLNNVDCSVSTAVMKNSKGEIREAIAWKLPTVKQGVLHASIVYNRLFKNKMYYDTDYFSNKEICFVECVPGALLMIDAEIMMKFGMYDEEFFLYGEETLLGYKFKKQGYKTILLLNFDYIHNHSVSINKSFHTETAKQKIFLNSKLIFLQKYQKVSRLSLLIAKMFFSYTLVEIVIVSFLKKIKSILEKSGFIRLPL